MRSLSHATLAVLGALALSGLAADSANAAAVLPDFGLASFAPGAPIDNPFFPLVHGRVRTYVAQGNDAPDEYFVLTDFVGRGPVLLGVQTSTQLDEAYEDGLLVERTRDYYAQDTAGNVWYFGEDVTNFFYDDEGNLIGTDNESAWRAGVNGALPGFIMPSDLTIGFNYFQEFAPNDDALDEGTTWEVGLARSVPAGAFTGVLRVLETSSIDPNLLEFKNYAPGFGLIAADEGLDEALMNPELRVELTSIGAIPEPASWLMLLLGFGAVGATLRRPRRLVAG